MAAFFDIGTEATEEKIFTIADTPFPLSSLFTPQSMQRALTFRPQPSDVILSSYPKCDSKIVDTIVWKLLYMDLKDPPVCTTTNRSIPCMEMTTIDDLSSVYEYMSRNRLPKLYKTYLPFKLIPFYKRAKYIYVMRTPWEACASYYAFLCLTEAITEPFDVFFSAFLHGKVPYGSYFKHIMPWNKRVQESNILILCREHVEHNTRSAMFTIAAFLGDRYLSQLIDNKEMEENLLNATSWDGCKDGKYFNANNFSQKYLPKSCFAHPCGTCVKYHCDGVKLRSKLKPTFIERQHKSMIEIISSKFKGSSIEFMWLGLLKKQAPGLFT